jgi:predicted DNA repair protein MutK
LNSLLLLIDDIATVLDDVALMTKVAAKKTAGVLGDDLALNAEQVSGVRAERELPVVWAVAKGSFINKLILVPAALLISALIPWLITPLLMLGGAYLCFEGFEKLAHKYVHDTESEHKETMAALADTTVDLVEFEKAKIQGAIRTDFVLSAEIIVIALGTVQAAAFFTQAAVVSTVAIVITIGVYGLVAGIVKLDDAGLALIQSQTQSLWGKLKGMIGRSLLWFAPVLMKLLAIVGTIAMFLVGGGILLHGIPGSHDLIHHAEEISYTLPMIGPTAQFLTPVIINGIAGVIAGAILVGLVSLINTLRK